VGGVLDAAKHHAVPFTAEEFEAADCVVLLTAHRDFVDEPLWDHAKLVVDTRNAVPDGPDVHRI
jgi:UDP-N-acetyl-D-mannosaminuronate dehydrogenase